VGSKKTMNVPNVVLNLPTLTKKDKVFIDFAIRHKLDFIAQSFVRSKEDVLAVKSILKKHNSKCKIIAKIENNQGVQNIDEIIDTAHGIMVARGDLGVELDAEVVPLVQKKIITKCIMKAKPVITATQMLQSMITHPRPTRAEVSDVANAILDGTDAIMLSGETAKGQYPVESVEVMSRIAKRVEASKPNFKYAAMKQSAEDLRTRLGKAALAISADTKINALIVPSRSGRTAKYISSFRGKLRIYAPAFDPMIMRQLQLSYGIHSAVIKKAKSTDTLLHTAITPLVKKKILKGSDVVIIVVASPAKFDHATNFMEINTVKNCLRYRGNSY
jgi:pyruvate kinase